MAGVFISKTSKQKVQLADQLSDMSRAHGGGERSFFRHGHPRHKNLKIQFHLFLPRNTSRNTFLLSKYKYKSHGFLLPARLSFCEDRRGLPDFNHFKIIRTPALYVCSVLTFSSVLYVWCSFMLTTTLTAGTNGPSAPISCRRKQKRGGEAI